MKANQAKSLYFSIHSLERSPCLTFLEGYEGIEYNINYKNVESHCVQETFYLKVQSNNHKIILSEDSLSYTEIKRIFPKPTFMLKGKLVEAEIISTEVAPALFKQLFYKIKKFIHKGSYVSIDTFLEFSKSVYVVFTSPKTVAWKENMPIFKSAENIADTDQYFLLEKTGLVPTAYNKNQYSSLSYSFNNLE